MSAKKTSNKIRLNEQNKKRTWVIAGSIFSIILIILFLLVRSEERLVFTFADRPDLWQISTGSAFRTVGNSVEIIKGDKEPYLMAPSLYIDAENYDVCEIEGEWPIAYDQGRLLFISPFNKRFDYNFRYDFDTGPAGRVNKIYLNLNDHPAWQHFAKAILIIPAKDSGKAYLRGIYFVRASFWTKTKAVWHSFSRYTEPLLGTCFAMATPIIAGQPFNPLVIPPLFMLLLAVGVISLVVHWFQLDQMIRKISVGCLVLAVFLAWGLLDLRNNVVYVKAITRNISLYWGKNMAERAGIAIGSPEFVDFMRFCDNKIPLTGQVFNQVAADIPGTAANYLSSVQYYSNFRPRYFNDAFSSVDSYFIFYLPENDEAKTIMQAQPIASDFLVLPPGELITQEVTLWRDSGYIERISLWLRSTADDYQKLDVKLIDRTGKIIVDQAELLTRTGDEAIFDVSSFKNISRGQKVLLTVLNKSDQPVEIGIYNFNGYGEGSLIFQGRRSMKDLAFRLFYSKKGTSQFGGFKNNAYILIDKVIDKGEK